VQDTCRDSTVCIAAWLRPRQPGNPAWIPTRGKRDFSIKCRTVLGPPNLLSGGYWVLFPPGVKLTTHLHIVSMLRIVDLFLHSHIRFHGVLLCLFYKIEFVKCSLSVCTHEAEPFSRSLQLCSHSRTSQHFMEPDGSLLCSEEPSTGPNPEPYQSNPYHSILSL
jgi:hypothetical protein